MLTGPFRKGLVTGLFCSKPHFEKFLESPFNCELIRITGRYPSDFVYIISKLYLFMKIYLLHDKLYFVSVALNYL